MQTYAKFFEKHYETYGRKIKWVSVQGRCEISPPDLPVLPRRGEAAQRRAQAVRRLLGQRDDAGGVLRRRGAGSASSTSAAGTSTREFNQSLRPFHWDVFMDGTRTASQHRRLLVQEDGRQAGDPRRRPGAARRPSASSASSRRPSRSRRRTRWTSTRWSPAASAARRPTPPSRSTRPPTSPQGQQTANVAVQKLKAEGVTTLVIMSDPINPTFTTTAATRQQWYPEHLLVRGRAHRLRPARPALRPVAVAQRLRARATWPTRTPPDTHRPLPGRGRRRRARQRRRRADLRLHVGHRRRRSRSSGPTLNPANVERGMLVAAAVRRLGAHQEPAGYLLKPTARATTPPSRTPGTPTGTPRATLARSTARPGRTSPWRAAGGSRTASGPAGSRGDDDRRRREPARARDQVGERWEDLGRTPHGRLGARRRRRGRRRRAAADRR